MAIFVEEIGFFGAIRSFSFGRGGHVGTEGGTAGSGHERGALILGYSWVSSRNVDRRGNVGDIMIVVNGNGREK